jgi:hypothetical protein
MSLVLRVFGARGPQRIVQVSGSLLDDLKALDIRILP